MEIFNISNKKTFMAQLLKGNLFDSFEVREIILHTKFKCIIDGKYNLLFFDEDTD